MSSNDVSTIPMSVIKAQYGPREGRHWFDRSTMRFFRSHLPKQGYRGPGGVFFVTSEQFVNMQRGDVHPRRYTVRQLVDGDINKASRAEAAAAAKLYAMIGTNGISGVN
jgi:hypothetical protein